MKPLIQIFGLVALPGLVLACVCGGLPGATSTPPTDGPDVIVPADTPLSEEAPTAVAQPTPFPTLPSNPVTQVSFGIPGTGVLYLAGRTDLTIPPLDQPLPEGFDGTCRQQVLETWPIGFQIAAGAVFTFKAEGLIDFYGNPVENGYAYGPDGQADSQSLISAAGGISGYNGQRGALVGLFLDDTIPNGAPPADILFTDPNGSPVGISFDQLTPEIGQAFFIGDGLNNVANTQQSFIAPVTATRLFLGFADSVDFYGLPGCYGDNVGAFGVDMQSSQPFTALPQP